MKKYLTVCLLTACLTALSIAQINNSEKLDTILPVRGFCISAPQPGGSAGVC